MTLIDFHNFHSHRLTAALTSVNTNRHKWDDLAQAHVSDSQPSCDSEGLTKKKHLPQANFQVCS